jgi:hypothetical protein
MDELGIECRVGHPATIREAEPRRGPGPWSYDGKEEIEYQAETPDLADLEIWQPSFPTPVTLPLRFVGAK